MKATLHFDMTIEIDDEKHCDYLGKNIAHDILCEMFNGEDLLEIEYKGHDTK
jgi:hypothetical protein